MGRRRTRGFTLIEVLVAIVLLMVGIYAILKIFPRGFETLERARAGTIAGRLAERELERWRLTASSLPDDIIATDAQGNPLDAKELTDAGFLPDDITPRVTGDFGNSKTSPYYEPDSVFLPRTIHGERVTIPVGEQGQVPFYVLAFAPIEPLEPNKLNAEWIRVYSTPYRRAYTLAQLAATPPPPRAFYYYLDEATGKFRFRTAGYERKVKLEYSYISGGEAHDVLFDSITVQANDNDYPRVPSGITSAYAAPSIAQFDRIISGSEAVYDAFEETKDIGDLAPDKPQGKYFLGDPDNKGEPGIFVGPIRFHPLDSGRQVRVDYRVKDWSIIHEDFETGAGSPVQLSLANIKGPDFKNPPRESNAEPLGQGAGKGRYVVLAVLDSGDPLTALYYGLHPGETLTNETFEVDYLHGRVTIPAAVGSSTRFRVYYRADGDWCVQVMKPAALYRRATANEQPGFRKYGWDGSSNQLYFYPQDVGQMVSVDYQTTNGERITGELHQIAPPGANGQCPIWTKQGAGPSDFGLLNTPRANSYLLVRGVSLRARVLYTTRGYSRPKVAAQQISTWPWPTQLVPAIEALPEAWHKLDFDTELTRPTE